MCQRRRRWLWILGGPGLSWALFWSPEKEWRWWRECSPWQQAVYRKGQSRLYFLRKLHSFNVCSQMLHVFYQSVLASAYIFAAICSGSSIRAGDSEKLNTLIKKDCSVLGTALETLELVVDREMLHKLLNIMENITPPSTTYWSDNRGSLVRHLIMLFDQSNKKSWLEIQIKPSNVNKNPICQREVD